MWKRSTFSQHFCSFFNFFHYFTICSSGGHSWVVAKLWKIMYYVPFVEYIIYLSDLPDILICGNCKEMFTNLPDIVEHKKNYCKLRFACKCGPRINLKAKTAFQNDFKGELEIIEIMVLSEFMRLVQIYSLIHSTSTKNIAFSDCCYITTFWKVNFESSGVL